MDKIIHSLPKETLLRGPKNTYRVQQALGQGTFGITYLATTEMTVSGQMGAFATTVKVAMKDYKRKFLREARLALEYIPSSNH